MNRRGARSLGAPSCGQWSTDKLWIGAAVGVVATYPLAALCGVVFRFPYPLGGYVSGLEALPLTAAAVTFYGLVFGGFGVQALAGAAALWVYGRWPGAQGRDYRLCMLASVAGAAPGVALMSLFAV